MGGKKKYTEMFGSFTEPFNSVWTESAWTTGHAWYQKQLEWAARVEPEFFRLCTSLLYCHPIFDITSHHADRNVCTGPPSPQPQTFCTVVETKTVQLTWATVSSSYTAR